MTALDRALVNKTITRTASGGAVIDMDGAFIANPTAAIETFHTVAEKQMGGRPYRYTYSVDKKQVKRTVPQYQDSSGGSSGGNYYMPIYTQPGGGEAAIILGSIALIIVLAKLAHDSQKPDKEDSATLAKPAASVTPPLPPKEETITTRILRVSGSVEPISQVTLDKSRLVEVLLPDEAPVIGKMKPAVSRAVAEEVRSGFEQLGCQVLIGQQSQQAGYSVRTSVLRAQGNALMYSNLTVEMTLVDQKTGKELTRWVVQASEKPLDINAQNERLYGPGIATSILKKPLKSKLASYLR